MGNCGATPSARSRSKIRLIEFEEFQRLKEFPRYPDNKDICVNIQDIDRVNSLIVFISHCWLGGDENSDNWRGRAHPDTKRNQKHRLCIKGISDLKDRLAPDMKHCYIWLDYGCVDQDGDPCGELEQLDEIVQMSDCMFTPIVGDAQVPKTIRNWFQEYDAENWTKYTSRAWCRVEMFYAANISCSNTKDRLKKFKFGLRHFAEKGIRPHILYGDHEYNERLPVIVVPPLIMNNAKEYDPAEGNLTFESDRKKIKSLMNDLKPHISEEKREQSAPVVTINQRYHRYRNGDEFYGMLRQGTPRGEGMWIFNNGDTLFGYWDGLYYPKNGMYTFANGASKLNVNSDCSVSLHVWPADEGYCKQELECCDDVNACWTFASEIDKSFPKVTICASLGVSAYTFAHAAPCSCCSCTEEFCECFSISLIVPTISVITKSDCCYCVECNGDHPTMALCECLKPTYDDENLVVRERMDELRGLMASSGVEGYEHEDVDDNEEEGEAD